jgi:hypothetical protein
MKGIKRDDEGKVIVPEGMIYIKEHPSVNKKGLVPKNVVVVEHYRNKKRKKVRQSWFPRSLTTIRRCLRWLK